MPVSAQLRQAVIARGQAIFNAAVDDVMADLRSAAPYASGATQRGLRKTPAGSPPVLAARVESTTPQGEWVEEGTRDVFIVPRSRKVLRFFVNGQEVFSPYADRPAQPARPWFRPVVDRWPQYLAGASR